jgi:hypothetical protein
MISLWKNELDLHCELSTTADELFLETNWLIQWTVDTMLIMRALTVCIYFIGFSMVFVFSGLGQWNKINTVSIALRVVILYTQKTE